MLLSINNFQEFLSCVNDFVQEEYGLVPRDFPLDQVPIVECSWVYDKEKDLIYSFECLSFNKQLHVHEEISDSNLTICCSQPDTTALLY